jgi:hypothetical protein
MTLEEHTERLSRSNLDKDLLFQPKIEVTREKIFFHLSFVESGETFNVHETAN